MNFPPSPEVVAARDAARRAHIESRKGWMEAARIYAKLLWPSDITRAGIRHCVSMAKRHSRVVSTSASLRRPELTGMLAALANQDRTKVVCLDCGTARDSVLASDPCHNCGSNAYSGIA